MRRTLLNLKELTMAYDADIETKSRDLIVLERARERIARGWCQCTQRRGNEYCIIGALRAAEPRREEIGYPEFSDFATLLGFRGNAMAMAKWNDAKCRTQAQVLARFDAAITKLSTPEGGGR